MSEEKKENVEPVELSEQEQEQEQENSTVLDKSLSHFAFWHERGRQSRIVLLIVGYIVLIIAMYGFPLFYCFRLFDFAQKSHNDVIDKESPVTCFAYLTPETSIELEIKNESNKECTKYTAKCDRKAVEEVNKNLDSLKRELQRVGDYKTTEELTELQKSLVGLTEPQRSLLREALTDNVLQSWKDLFGRGILKEPIVKDVSDMVKSEITIEGDLNPLPCASVLTLESMVDFMVAKVTPWGEYSKEYKELFQKLVKPTLVDVNAAEGGKEIITKKFIMSGDTILLKGEKITEEKYALFKAYSEKFLGKYWWSHHVVRMLIFIVCIVMFWFVLEKYHGGFHGIQGVSKSDVMYSYFPMLALLLGLAFCILWMDCVMALKEFFPRFNKNFLLKYLYVIYPMLLPSLLISITYRYDTNISLFTGLFFSVLCSLVSISGTYSIISVGFCASVGCVLCAKKINSTRILMSCTICIQFACAMLALLFDWSIHLMRGGHIWDLQNVWILVIVFIYSVVTAFIIAPLCMQIMEMFGADTRPIYNELSSMSNSLMSSLAEQAPGTFYHCVKVANMAAFAAEKMSDDFDPVAIRACAMFHDIGKLKRPGCFMENGGEMLRKDYESYLEMSQILVNHVKDGVDIANRKKLPHLIREVIRTHHGNSIQKYFLQQAKANNEIADDVYDEKLFSYPAENPMEPEAFLIGMADACEAAVNGALQRTNYKEKDSYVKMIEKVVNEVFASRQKDGFMENAHVKISDLTIMRRMFIEHLSGQFKRSNDSYDKTKSKEDADAAKESNGNAEEKEQKSV